MLSSASRGEGSPVFGQHLDTSTNTRQAAAVDTRRSISSRNLAPSTSSLVHYRPRTTREARLAPAFPTPHIRARQRRPHTIHIVSYPAGYIPTELRGILPPGHTDPSDSPRRPRHPRKRASKDQTTGQSLNKRKKPACQEPHHTVFVGQDICSCADSPSTTARVLDKLRSVIFSPPTSLPPKAAVDQQAPLATELGLSSQRRITVTTRPARPNSFLSFSRRLSASPSLAHDISHPVLELEPTLSASHFEPPSFPSSFVPDHIMAETPPDRAPAACQPLQNTGRTTRRSSTMSGASRASTDTTRLPTSIAHPIASGGGIAVDIVFAEPHIFLRGFEHNHLRGRERSSSFDVVPHVLRGKMRLVVTKDVKIRGINIRLRNKASTHWPQSSVDGLKSDFTEDDILRTQTLTVFNAIHGKWLGPYGDVSKFELRNQAQDSLTSLFSRFTPGSHAARRTASDTASINSNTARETLGFALDSVHARSFEKTASPLVNPTQAKGFQLFRAGTYEYSFDFPIDHHQVETIKLPHGSVMWHVEAIIERAGAFKPNLFGSKEVNIVRVPDLLSQETSEPVALARHWDNQMYYEACISGKSFLIGGNIPIAFKITPLAKVQVHKIKVYISETIEYKARHKNWTRKDASNKVLLFEKSAGQKISEKYRGCDFRFVSGGEENGVSEDPQHADSNGTNLLGNLEAGNESYWTSTELEMNVKLPTCSQMRDDSSLMLYPDTSWRNGHVNHSIKVQMRVSRVDPEDPEGKRRRHYEISIDSPITILSCAASQGNTVLPRYTGTDIGLCGSQQSMLCSCTDSLATISARPGLSDMPPSFSGIPYVSQPINTAPHSRLLPSSSDDSIVNIPAVRDDGGEGSRSDMGRAPAPAPSISPSISAQGERALTDLQPSEPARPIHLIRVPSFAPPAFDDDNSPPAPSDALSPPPLYEAIIGSPSVDGLADYFLRLDQYDHSPPIGATADEVSDSDGENSPTRIASRTGRVNVSNPRTPGGIRHGPSRSMEIPRPTAVFNLQLPTPTQRITRR